MSLKQKLSKAGFPKEGSGDSESQSVLARAVSLHLDGKPKEALKELDTAVGIAPNNPEILAARAHVLCELENWTEATVSYAKLVELSPRNGAAMYNLAVCLEKTGQWEQGSVRFEAINNTR